MSNGYGWTEQDPYGSPEQHPAPGVMPPRRGTGASGPRPPYGAYGGAPQAHHVGTYPGPGGPAPAGQRPIGQGPVVPRNEYGQAPPDTDAGRGGSHPLSLFAILLYLGLFVGLPLLVMLGTLAAL